MTRWEQYWEQQKTLTNPYPRRKHICSAWESWESACYCCFLREICNTDEMIALADKDHDEFERRIDKWLDEEVDE